MFVFDFDLSKWYFPLCFVYDTVGNRHRLWTFRIGFLCFSLVICIDEESR